ncbi:GSCOCT00013836001.3-RA-CDS, partial [Cotesia congregata]
ILNSKLMRSDELLKNSGVSINIQREFALSMKFAVGWFIYSFYINAVAVIWYDKSFGLLNAFILVLTFHHGFHVNYIVDLTFFLLIIHMKARFEGINKLLSDLFNLQVNNLFQNMEAFHKWTISRQTNFENDFTITFCSIKRIHLELKILCNEIMKIYGFSISLMILTMFFLVIVQLFNMYTVIVNTETKLSDKSLHLLSMSSWVLIALLKFFCINYACAEAINEWNKTGEIIHKLEIEYEDSKFQREIQKFSIQILQNPLKFTPCGFLDLDYYFIRDFAGSVMAQLVLLIQTTSRDNSSSQRKN